MSVAKMQYINVIGPEAQLPAALQAVAATGSFAPEEGEAIHSPIRFSQNQYAPQLTKAKGLLKDLGCSTLAAMYTGDVAAYDLSGVAAYLEQYAGEVAQRSARRTAVQNELELYRNTEEIVGHMADLDFDIDDIFRVETLKVRVGRLPKSSYKRLAYYAEKGFDFTAYFNFTVFDFDGEYYSGMYFAPRDNAKEIDDIFASLYFQRTRIPEFVHGKPVAALAAIRAHESELQAELQQLSSPDGIATAQVVAKIQDMTAWLALQDQLYEMQKYALVFDHTFYISGFVPRAGFAAFSAAVTAVAGVKLKEATNDAGVPAAPPVKLRNHWWARPYEMFTEMYGLPTYHDIDPTAIVSVLYSVLYGIMFADLGQGLVLGLVGYFYMYRRRGMEIGRILARAAIFSCLFGILFGSVFGFENVLDPFWHALGFAEKPFEVMAPANVNTILLASAGIGAVVTTFAIAVGLASKLRRRLTGEALTSPNGLAGLVFYLALLGLLLDKLVLKKGFSSSFAYLVLLVVVPLLIMYLQEPLAHWINTRRFALKNPGETLLTGFFELFVTLLEYLSNTVSFLRVGGFVLVHAGMMQVVMTLADIAGGAAPVVYVIGNIFVIALEGLIVGIQTLRLNYYEVFSRFYEADGKPFEPLLLKPDMVEL